MRMNLLTTLAIALLISSGAIEAQAQSRRAQPATQIATKARIDVATAHSRLSLFVAADDGRLYQLRYGAASESAALPTRLNRQDEFYPPGGDGFISEPAIQVTHADGNTS